MKKILIFGKNGQIGRELQKVLANSGNVIALGSAEADFTKPDLLSQTLQKLKPDIIVNAAAYTAVDKAESDKEQALLVNGIASGILAKEARRLGALLIHYSTDYVFNGESSSPYTEDHAPHPINVYGETKLYGEKAIQDADCNHLILRTSWVYGTRGNNFLLKMLQRAKEKNELRVVVDQIGSPTWSHQIAQATAQILERIENETGDKKWGIYHLTAAGHTSWHGFAEQIFSYYENKPKVTAILSREYPVPAPRPKYSVLSTLKLQKTFGLNMLAWEQSLQLCLTNLNRS